MENTNKAKIDTIYSASKRTCYCLPVEDFERALHKIWGRDDIGLEWSGIDFVITDVDGEVIDDTALTKISEYFGVKVSSVHYDGYDWEMAWLVLE